MASKSNETTVTSVATFTSSVSINTTVYNLSTSQASSHFSPRPFSTMKTRSSTGSLVKSAYMHIKVSPDRTENDSTPRYVPEVNPTHPTESKSSADDATAVEEVSEPSPKTPPLAPVSASSTSPASNSYQQSGGLGGFLPCESPSFLHESVQKNDFNRSCEQDLDISHLTKRIDVLEADVHYQTIYNLLQNDKIRQLEKRVNELQGELMQMDAKFAVRDHVVEALRNEVHRLQQYTRRYSVAVVGIDKKRNETDESLREEVLKLVADINSTSKEDDIDKFHRNGRLFNGKDQEIIIRFKSHAAKEAFYRARKNLPPSRKSVKIRPSLSTNQKNLLRDSQSWVEEYCLNSEMVNPVQFVFANIHGEIQAKMQKKYRGSPFITFNSVQDLASKLKDAQVVKETDRVFDEFFTRFDNDSSHPPRAETVDDDNLGFNGL